MFGLKRTLRRPSRLERGQTATEYMLVISTLVIAVAGISYLLIDDNGPVEQGLNDLLGSGNASSQSNVPGQVSRGYVTSNPRQ